MNKKLVVAAALFCGAVGLIVGQGTVKAQDATDNSAMMNNENAMMNDENAMMNNENAMMNDENAMNAENMAADNMAADNMAK